ncbi:hypothetical protein [Streptomyces sp. NPDC007355]|uniref:hypothetical protein n=1 Tax=Streptomyces sp. NPDC007355 TaxID=3364778 RepID=UPI0036847DDB
MAFGLALADACGSSAAPKPVPTTSAPATPRPTTPTPQPTTPIASVTTPTSEPTPPPTAEPTGGPCNIFDPECSGGSVGASAGGEG